MSPDVLKQTIAAMTAEERREVASRMVIPFRCGGCNYDAQGRRQYLVGGRYILEDSDEFRELVDRLNRKL